MDSSSESNLLDLFHNRNPSLSGTGQSPPIIGQSLPKAHSSRFAAELERTQTGNFTEHTAPHGHHSKQIAQRRKLGIFGILLKMVWQVTLFAAAIIRCDLLSLVYFLTGICHKFAYILPGLNVKSAIVKFACGYSCLLLIARIVYQSVAYYQKMKTGDIIAAPIIGFVSIDDVGMAFRQFLPEALVFFVSILMLSLGVYKDNLVSMAYRRRVRGSGSLAAYVLVGFMICTFFAAVLSPNALSLLYVIYLVIEVLVWASLIDSLCVISYLMRHVIVVYNLAHSILLYLFQIDVLQQSVSKDFKNILGLYDCSANSFFYQILYIIMVMGMCFTISSHGYICIRYRLSRDLLPFAANLHISKHFLRSRARDNDGAKTSFLARLSHYILRNGSRLATIMTLCSAFTFPSFLSLPLLIWSCITILAPVEWFIVSSYSVLVYMGSFVVLQSIWNISGSRLPQLTDVGLVEYEPAWAFIGLQMLLFYVFTLICFPWETSSHARSEASMTASSVSRATSFRRFVPETSPPVAQQQHTEPSDNETSYWKHVLYYVWSKFKNLFLAYAYLVSVIVLFFCGLQQVNIINTVFLLYSIAFLIFPRLARKFWISLVVYTEIIIVLLFIWQLTYFKSRPIEYARLWGLENQGTLWKQLQFHIVILLFTSIQLNTYRLLDKKQRMSAETDRETLNEEDILPDAIKNSWIRKFGMRLSDFLETITSRYTLIACYLVFSLISLLKPVTVFDLGYLVIFSICLILHQVGMKKVIQTIWVAVCLYAAIVTSACYTYQFVEIQNVWEYYLGKSTALDLGLVAENGADLFEYLIQHIVALFLCVFQYRLFTNDDHRSMKPLFGKEGSLYPSLQKYAWPLVCFFKRVCIIHLTKVVHVLSLLISVIRPSLIGLFLLVYVVMTVSSARMQRKTKLFYMLLVQVIILSQLAYQLGFIQNMVQNHDNANYIGYVRYEPNKPPIKYMSISILLLYTLALQVPVSYWKSQARLGNGRLSLDETDWPLFDIKDDVNPPLSPQTIVETKTVPEQSVYASFNYWLSNAYKHFGLEPVLMLHAIAALAKLNMFGLFYLVMLGIWLYYSPNKVWKSWIYYMISIMFLIMFQYVSAIGLLPSSGHEYRWYDLDPTLLKVLGIPVNKYQLMILPDLFLLMACSFQWTFIKRMRYPEIGYGDWKYDEVYLNIDFALKPRTKINQVKFVLIRHFLWVPILLSFVQGTANINIPGFIFLTISLHLISLGESAIMVHRKRKIMWNILIWYSYIWVVAQVVYQIPAQIIPLENQDPKTSTWSRLRNLFALYKMNVYPDMDNYIFTYSNQLLMFLFVSVLYQRRLNRSNALFFVKRYVKNDQAMAHNRAKEYRIKRRQEIDEQKSKFDTEVNALRDKVADLKNFQSDVQDWIRLYGRRQDEYGYSLVERVLEEDGVPRYEIVRVDEDDPTITFRRGSHSRRTSTPAFNTFPRNFGLRNRASFISNSIESSPFPSALEPQATSSSLQMPSASRSRASMTATPVNYPSMERVDRWVEEQPIDEVERQKIGKRILEQQSIFIRVIDGIINWLFRFAVEYTDLYATASQSNLSYDDKRDKRLWAFCRGLFYAILSHTALICYLAIFANQAYHGNLLSTVPLLAVLIIGMCERPYPSRYFWQFLIIFMEITVVLKFFFQFDIWRFNDMCPRPETLSEPVYMVGLQKSCGSFFVDVITELIVLLCCIFHRGMMKRLGLWEYFDEIRLKKETIERSQTANSLLPVFTMQTPGGSQMPTIEDEDAEDYGDADLDNQSSQEDADGSQEGVDTNERIIDWKDEYGALPNINSMFFRVWMSVKLFFDKEDLPGVDYYLGYFTADFIVFLLTIFFWTSFSGDQSTDSNLQFLYTVFNQNTVPPLFAAMLIINFCLIIVDRAIYTSKSLVAKYIIHFTTVIVFTLWLFFVLPISNNEPFSQLPTLQLWFFAKCCYWYFSSLQIKSGFPRVRIMNFLMKNYSNTNRFAFLVFRAIPFVWEVRTLVDWSITETSLGLYNWLKFEDVYANTYLIKASREIEKTNTRKFGERQNSWLKFLSGSGMVLLLIAILWFPLILLSIPGSTKINPIKGMSVSVEIVGFEKFYSQSLPQPYIYNYTGAEFDELRSTYRSFFPSYFASGFMQRARFQPNSMNFWAITPPAKSVLAGVLNSSFTDLVLYTSFEMQKDEQALVQIVRGNSFTPLPYKLRQKMATAIASKDPGSYAIDVPNCYPKLLHSMPNGQVFNLAPEGQMMINCTLKYVVNDNQASWWDFYIKDDTENLIGPTFNVLSDNIPAISSLSSYGIIGLYVAVVFAAGRFIRIILSDLTLRIIYEDLPNPDPIVRLCSDTVLAREFGDFETEETLYWQLITLYRSPQQLLEKTRIPPTAQQ